MRIEQPHLPVVEGGRHQRAVGAQRRMVDRRAAAAAENPAKQRAIGAPQAQAAVGPEHDDSASVRAEARPRSAEEVIEPATALLLAAVETHEQLAAAGVPDPRAPRTRGEQPATVWAELDGVQLPATHVDHREGLP